MYFKFGEELLSFDVPEADLAVDACSHQIYGTQELEAVNDGSLISKYLLDLAIASVVSQNQPIRQAHKNQVLAVEFHS